MDAEMKVVAWLRNERGDFEGQQTLDPLVMLGEPVAVGHHGATYEPLVTRASARARIGVLEAEKAALIEQCAEVCDRLALESEPDDFALDALNSAAAQIRALAQTEGR